MLVNNQGNRFCFGCFFNTNSTTHFCLSNKIYHTSLTNQTKFDSIVLCKKWIRF